MIYGLVNASGVTILVWFYSNWVCIIEYELLEKFVNTNPVAINLKIKAEFVSNEQIPKMFLRISFSHVGPTTSHNWLFCIHIQLYMLW